MVSKYEYPVQLATSLWMAMYPSHTEATMMNVEHEDIVGQAH